MKLTLTDKFAPFLFEKKRFKVAYGGRSGTKSNTIAKILLYKGHTEAAKIGCFREHQNTIEDSVHSLLEAEINNMKIPGYRVNKSNIEHESGGKFRFKGLSRSIEGVKSFHGFDIFWLEEAQFISKTSLKTLTPTLREEGSECWLTLNPLSRLDHVSKRFILPFYKELLQTGIYEDDLHYIIWSNYDENPWMPETLEMERALDYQMLSRAEYDHTWLGYFNDTVENAVIHAEWFDAAIDAHKKLGIVPTGAEIVTHDPSDLGKDDKGLLHRKGILIKDCALKPSGDVNEGLDWALDYTLEHKPDWFIWDSDGIGLGLVEKISRALKGTKIDYIGYRGGGTVEHPEEIYAATVYDEIKARTNIDAFYNLRAQKIWHLRDRFIKTFKAVEMGEYVDPDEIIAIDGNIEALDLLRSETCRIPRVPNGAGKIQIMSKPMMLSKHNIESPNLFDCLTMSEVDVSEYIEAQSSVNLRQESLW